MDNGDVEPSHGGEGLFADRQDRLHRLGPPLPAGIPLVLWPRPMLMQALLAESIAAYRPRNSFEAAALAASSFFRGWL
jgi:hypothetical protein